MTVGSNEMPASRSSRSEIDSRAIGAVGRLLIAGIWLECRLKSVPKIRIGALERSPRLGATAPESRTGFRQTTQSRNEEQ
jgi:hypothetical protein